MSKPKNLVHKVLGRHLVSGSLEPGDEIAIRIDQTLTQDATGTMAYLQFEAMGVPRVRTELSVSYVDHNTLQPGFENADDHRFLRSVAAKYGIHAVPTLFIFKGGEVADSVIGFQSEQELRRRLTAAAEGG